MKRIKSFAWLLLVVVAVCLAGCGPNVVVENKTGFAVRVVITSSDGSEVFSPSPGESSTAEVSEGAYRATAIPDADWIEYAKLTRKVLNDQLANSQNLTGPQLLDVVQRLKDIAARMQQFEQAGATSASCGGSVTSDSTGLVTISTASGGSLVVACK